MKLKSKWAVVLPRIVLRLWHSIWIDYWRERLDDPVTFTDSSGISHAQGKHAAHVWAWRNTFPQNDKDLARRALDSE